MRVPTLDELLTAFSVERAIPPSTITSAQMDDLEVDLQLTLPRDYRELMLRYDLTAIEFEFTRFCPPVLPGEDALQGIWQALRGARDPFRDIYLERGVVPVATDWAENYFVLIVRPPSPSAIQRLGDAVIGRPQGSIWLFDWEGGFWDFEGGTSDFSFVSSTFSQALHLALYLHNIKDELRSGQMRHEEAWEMLEAIDPSVEGHDYWRRWIRNLAR